MKFELPNENGLSERILSHLSYIENDSVALTDVQYAALEAGLGRGVSCLITSPTSTGKTLIAEWAIARGLETHKRSVYLVTHRALARQKFSDFTERFHEQFLGGNLQSIVLATGDEVVDGEGSQPSDPLQAPLLIATYEKYLALLSASGIPTNMRNTVIVCDEVQLIGDKNRGQNVEILLTLLKNAGWYQLVGLSAVLAPNDARDLANWLDVTLVSGDVREKHLRYEYWQQNQIISSSTSHPGEIRTTALPAGIGSHPSTISVVRYLLAQPTPPVPIIVFCMKKRDIYDLAEELIGAQNREPDGPQLSLDLDDLPETSARTFLSQVLSKRVAVHSADLTDEERRIVETRLLNREVDVVFATSTLAAGVNFPLGAAVFADTTRWDQDRKEYLPIEASEFHNMAGRVGRMGFDHDDGRVIYTQNPRAPTQQAADYLNLNSYSDITPQLSPEKFDQISLQLVASELCESRDAVIGLICGSFSGLMEEDLNNQAFLQWPTLLHRAINQLADRGLLVETGSGQLMATAVGKAISQSGLLPATGLFLLDYSVKEIEALVNLLPDQGHYGDIDTLARLLFSACLLAPEFTPTRGIHPTRFIPWPLGKGIIFSADQIAAHLAEKPWEVYPGQINAMEVAVQWINGYELRSLEQTTSYLTAGMLRELFRNLAWALNGFATILTAASDKRVPPALRPMEIRGSDEMIFSLSKLPRLMRRLAFRLSEGLPDETLWLLELNQPNSPFFIRRSEILSLWRDGFYTPESLMLGTEDADKIRLKAFETVKPAPHPKANWLRNSVREWKMNQRRKSADRHKFRGRNCLHKQLIDGYYQSLGDQFEQAFEAVLNYLGVDYDRLDDKKVIGAPDYLVKFQNSPPLVVELKSKQNEKLVDYNDATEVLAASEIHGHGKDYCVTLCHPGVDPSVPLVITKCGRLSVVESHDLGEALLRLCERKITQYQLWQWLATPGQALSSDLPFTSHTQ